MKNWKWAIDNNLTIYNREELFDDMLNDIEPTVKLCGLEYLPADTLKSVDPIAYRCAVSDYIDSLLTDGQFVELEDGTLVDATEYTEAMEGESA